MGVFRGVAKNPEKWPFLADFGTPGKSCNFCKFRAFSGTPIFAIFGDFLAFRLKKIWFWRSKNGQKMAKKCRILSRLGELLNTQRNVHFLASRPAPAGPARGRSWGGYPGLPGGAPGHPLPGLRIGGYRGVSWEGGVPIVGLPVVARLPGSYCMISAVALTRCRSSRCCTPTMMLRW